MHRTVGPLTMAFGSTFFGVCFALLNALLSSAGYIMQRKATLLNAALPEDSRRKCSFGWLVGVLVYISAAPPDVISYALAPQMVCSAIACLRLALVAMLANIFLSEPLGRREWVGILFCMVGTSMVLCFGPGDANDTTSGHFYRPKVVSYLSCAGVAFICLVLVEHLEHLGIGPLPRVQRVTLPVITALDYGLGKVFNSQLRFLKMPENIIEEPLWLATVLMVALLGLGDLYCNLRGASRFPISVFVPVVFAGCTLIQYLQAVLLFDEGDNLSLRDFVLSLLGALWCLIGALMISPPSCAPLPSQPPLIQSESPIELSLSELEHQAGMRRHSAPAAGLPISV